MWHSLIPTGVENCKIMVKKSNVKNTVARYIHNIFEWNSFNAYVCNVGGNCHGPSERSKTHNVIIRISDQSGSFNKCLHTLYHASCVCSNQLSLTNH